MSMKPPGVVNHHGAWLWIQVYQHESKPVVRVEQLGGWHGEGFDLVDLVFALEKADDLSRQRAGDKSRGLVLIKRGKIHLKLFNLGDDTQGVWADIWVYDQPLKLGENELKSLMWICKNKDRIYATVCPGSVWPSNTGTEEVFVEDLPPETTESEGDYDDYEDVENEQQQEMEKIVAATEHTMDNIVGRFPGCRMCYDESLFNGDGVNIHLNPDLGVSPDSWIHEVRRMKPEEPPAKKVFTSRPHLKRHGKKHKSSSYDPHNDPEKHISPPKLESGLAKAPVSLPKDTTEHPLRNCKRKATRTSGKERLCMHCNKTVHKGSYARHLDTHKPQRPAFTCKTCNFSFKRRDHLLRHEKIHTQGRTHLCAKCGFVCARNDQLVAHLRKSHEPFKLYSAPARSSLDSANV